MQVKCVLAFSILAAIPVILVTACVHHAGWRETLKIFGVLTALVAVPLGITWAIVTASQCLGHKL